MPIVVVAAGPVADDLSIPFVLATDVVRVGAGEGFPIDAIAHAIAARLGEEAAPLAARVPRYAARSARGSSRSFSRKNAIVAALDLRARRRPARC